MADTQGGTIEICGNEQFTLGRDPELCRYSWSSDLTISRQHLRVHCILYEQDPISDIAPFVYATDVSANGTYLRKSNEQGIKSHDRGILMGRRNTFLLNDEDEIAMSETVRLIFRSRKSAKPFEFTEIQEQEKTIFARDFLVTNRLLGEGGYGKVLIAIDQMTQRQLACKMITLDALSAKPLAPCLRLPTESQERKDNGGRKRWPTRVAACFREFDILKDLSHPNIVQVQKVFWSNKTIYILQELVTGGDLFSFLEYNGGRLDNAQATVIIRQVLIGVEYLHDQDIVHRDLKPDNILMTSLEDGARVVITDFGNARFLPNAASKDHQGTAKYQRMFSYVGTLEFAAPEIHKANRAIPAEEGYSRSVDMWSIGAITATILTGNFIFTNVNHPRYLKDPRSVIIGLAAKCDLSVLDDRSHPSWGKVGHIPKDFIKRLLVLEENDRMTANEALAHGWFTNKWYAQELGDLYARSIEDWRPRATDSQLVERISKSLPDLSVVRLPGHAMSEEAVSHFFHPSEQSLTHSIIQTLGSSQYYQANASPPLVATNFDQDNFELASQIKPTSYDTDAPERLSESCRNPGNQIQQLQRQQSNHPTEHYNEYSSIHQDELPQVIATEGEHFYIPNSDEEESYGSVVDLDDFIHVAQSQHPYDSNTRQDQGSVSSGSVLVQETPVDQYATELD